MVVSALVCLLILAAGAALVYLDEASLAIARRAAPYLLSYGKTQNVSAYTGGPVYTSVCLLSLAERLDAMGYTLAQKRKTEWCLLEEPAFILNVISLSVSATDFIASFGVKEKSTVNRLTLSIWLDKLEYIQYERQLDRLSPKDTSD